MDRQVPHLRPCGWGRHRTPVGSPVLEDRLRLGESEPPGQSENRIWVSLICKLVAISEPECAREKVADGVSRL